MNNRDQADLLFQLEASYITPRVVLAQRTKRLQILQLVRALLLAAIHVETIAMRFEYPADRDLGRTLETTAIDFCFRSGDFSDPMGKGKELHTLIHKHCCSFAEHQVLYPSLVLALTTFYCYLLLLLHPAPNTNQPSLF